MIKTIKEISSGIYKEKGSKFIGYAYPVKSEEEVQQILKLLKKNIILLDIIVMHMQ